MLQESALKTYLFTYGNYYSSLSLEQLSTMFDMPQKKVGCGWDCWGCWLPSVSSRSSLHAQQMPAPTCPPTLPGVHFVHHLQ